MIYRLRLKKRRSRYTINGMISCAEDLTPDMLTAILSDAGLLSTGEVSSIERRPTSPVPFGSSHQLYHLSVRYTNPGVENTPERLFLKFGSSHKENFFYQKIAPQLGLPTMMRCYYSSYDPASDKTCLILEDLSATHEQSPWPVPPAIDCCAQTVQRLAEIHARGWQHPALEAEYRPALPKGRCWNDRLGLAVEKLPGFLDFLGDRLSPARRSIYDRLLPACRLWERLPGQPHHTLIHGDFHFWNVLYPVDPGRETLRIFDWNMWDIGRPPDDLAYLLALHWFPEMRARLEDTLLRQYHERLAACGITDYTWEMLAQDYRAAVIRCLLIPVWQWVRGIHPMVWWTHLERGMLAYADLHCADLL